VKIPVKTSSWIVAALCWVLFSALSVFILLGMRDRAALIRDTENERIFTALFTSLRNYDTIGDALESNSLLHERIKGYALYGADLACRYRWGDAPETFDESLLGKAEQTLRFGRYTLPDRKAGSVKFVIHTERMSPPPPPASFPPPQRGEGGRRARAYTERRPGPRTDAPPDGAPRVGAVPGGGFGGGFPIMAGDVRYIYIDISHAAYWRAMVVTSALFPLTSLALLALIVFIRRLFIGNIEYRERIEAQKNLVVLGTAAGALAHEIKNPLLSIRLQTGILEKTTPLSAKTELGIINQEVDRLSSLAHRVSDYLREGAGNAAPIDAYALLKVTGERLCGRDIVTADSLRDAVVFADSERLRSVFENLIRNALESGGPADEVGASIGKANAQGASNAISISVFDRGKGIAGEDAGRVFDPFFTKKSIGTGIGLSISKRFVEAAGGSITLANRDGGGVEARVTLPAYNGGKR
jgi:two-component system sensor histidine kinase HydH